MLDDFDHCYGAVRARDPRFDGMFVTAVKSSGVYCRPSCPAITPKRANVRFFATAAAAQAAGYRACKRCRPDASPGSPEWNVRADVVGRAMRLIADGIVDRDGVAGLAHRLHYSERHLHRQLISELGAGAQAIARAHRAQTARVLIETTPLAFSEVAFAAGFASVRQFNDTIRAVFASTPTELRARRGTKSGAARSIRLRLPHRLPLHAGSLFDFLGARAIPGIEEYDGHTYRRSLRLPHNSGVVELRYDHDHITCLLRLDDVRDLAAAVQRCRRLLDLDADPIAIDEALGADPFIRPLVRRAPGRRIPRAVDGFELVVRAVVGQQVSVKGARTLLARIVARFGKPLDAPDGGLTHTFPDPDALADADLSNIGLTSRRRATIADLAAAIASGAVAIDPGADREETRVALLAIPGVGRWTASYIALRALGDPDAFMPTDLGIRRALVRLGVDGDHASITERWRPWRGYAMQHLWEPFAPDRRTDEILFDRR